MHSNYFEYTPNLLKALRINSVQSTSNMFILKHLEPLDSNAIGSFNALGTH